MCHHARNKNIHCLETESQSFLDIFGHFQFLGAAWPQGQYIIFHSLPVMSMYDSEDPMYIFLMLFKLLPFTTESTISPVVFYPRPYTLWTPKNVVGQRQIKKTQLGLWETWWTISRFKNKTLHTVTHKYFRKIFSSTHCVPKAFKV